MNVYNYEDCPQGLSFANNGRNLNYFSLFMHISELLISKNKIKILEIGSGGGRNLQAIHQKFGSKVELSGTDISNAAINYARSLKIGKFYLARSDVIPIADKFDLILMIDILEHLEAKCFVKEILDNALLHLSNDGHIYISIPIELNRFSLTWFFSNLPYFKNLTKRFYGHSIQFDIKSFFALIDSDKFKLKEIFYSVHFLTQLQVLFFFFLPKILLQFFLGEETAINLRDSNEIINYKKKSLLNIFKRTFISLSYPLSYLAFKESSFKRNSSLGAGNMHLLIAKGSIKQK